jgi:large subunit ribosomal protein L25
MNLSIRKINVTAPTADSAAPRCGRYALKIGKSIKVGELSYEGLEIATGKDVVVCSIKMTRNAAQAAKEAAAAE